MKHSVLLAEALHAVAGCLLLSFAEVLLMNPSRATCNTILHSNCGCLTIHNFGVPWDCVSHCRRNIAAMVLVRCTISWRDSPESFCEASCPLLPQFDLRTQLQIPSILKIRAHSSRPLRTQLQVFPQSFLQKSLCAHSYRGRPRTQLGLYPSLTKTNPTSP